MPISDTIRSAMPVGPGAGPGMATGIAPKTGWLEGMLGPTGAKVGKTIGKYAPHAFIAYALMQYLNRSGQEAQLGLQTEALESQAEAIDPEAMMYQALSQSSQGEEQFARSALVNKLMGTLGPSLARGEERI